MTRREYESGARWCVWRWKDITWKGKLYLRRLHVFQCPWFSIMVHFIKDRDRQRHMHDHPVSMFCLILKGRYLEEVEETYWDGYSYYSAIVEIKNTMQRKYYNWIPHYKKHRISLVSDGGVITLCLAGPRRGEWGFYTENGWIPYRKYQKLYGGGTS